MTRRKMTQNIYDDAAFFAAYSKLPRSVEGLAGAERAPAWSAGGFCGGPEAGPVAAPDAGGVPPPFCGVPL